jgi:hypothetical protein
MANAAQVAQEIADKVFGSQSNTFAAQEIYGYLEEADAAEFTADLEKVIAQAKLAHKTTAPTPEQVFFLFDEIWGA